MMLTTRNVEKMDLSSVPLDVDSVQVSDEIYIPEMKKQIRRYKQLMQERFPGHEKYGRFRIEWNSHDFGRYGSLVFQYDWTDEQAEIYALYLEENLPKTWNDKTVNGQFSDFLENFDLV